MDSPMAGSSSTARIWSFFFMRELAHLREQVFGLTPTVLVSFRSYALKNLSVRVSPPSGEVAPKALQGPRGRDECPEQKSGSNLLRKGEGLEPNDRLSRAYERED